MPRRLTTGAPRGAPHPGGRALAAHPSTTRWPPDLLPT